MAKQKESQISIYEKRRTELGLTRAEAADRMSCISVDHLEKLENGRLKLISPDDALELAKAYSYPRIINHYCTHECPIGRVYVPEVEAMDLHELAIKLNNALVRAHSKRQNFFEIVEDGTISRDELESLIDLQEELQKINAATDSLQSWINEKMADKSFDEKEYKRLLKERKSKIK